MIIDLHALSLIDLSMEIVEGFFGTFTRAAMPGF